MSRTASPESIARKEQKAYEERKLITKNRCLSRFSLMNKRTLHQQLHEVGYTDIHIQGLYPDDKPITIKDINESFEKWWTDLEAAHQIVPQPVIEPTVIIKAPAVLDKIEPAIDETNPILQLPMNCTLLSFQAKAAWELVTKLHVEHKPAVLLRAAVGLGKTFIVGAEILYSKVHNLVPESYGLFPVIYITKASIVEQTQRVLQNLFGLNIDDVFVTNIEALRTQKFKWAIKREMIVEHGQERELITWRACHPSKLYWDECQGLKNEDSIQSRISQAFNEVEGTTQQIFFSATPFLRPSECKCFAVATKLPVRFGAGVRPLSNEIWPAFVKEVAHPAKPDEYCTEATKRLMRQLLPYIVDVKGVRSQFRARNKAILVDFPNEELRQYYNTAITNYEKDMAKLRQLEGEGVPGIGFMMLAKFTILRKAAEYCHAEGIADRLADAEKKGYAPFAFGSFKVFITRIVRFLIEKHGYTRNDISIVWGGGKSGPNKKQQLRAKLEAKAELLRECGMSLEDFDLDTVDSYKEEKVLPEWRLGTQSLQDRQHEIDNYNGGRTKFMLYTSKAGGAGLSVHHSDELTTTWRTDLPDFPEWKKKIDVYNSRVDERKRCKPGKARRKPNGWYYEEDIKFIPTRPRKGFGTPTYSGVEFVQCLGRGPRITSMSDTEQDMCFFNGTIEVKVHERVSEKLCCLRQVTRTKESWEDIIAGRKFDEKEFDEKPGEMVSVTEDDEDGSGMFISEDEEPEDEE